MRCGILLVTHPGLGNALLQVVRQLLGPAPLPLHCRCLEVEAERKLSYSWVVGDIDTVVTFTLSPTAAGTHLSIVPAGFKPDQKQNVAGARYGWKMMGGKLVDLLDALA